LEPYSSDNTARDQHPTQSWDVLLQGEVHWTEPFKRRLSRDVKLVGPTISCEGVPLHGDMLGQWRRNPHVQSYAFATDKVRAVSPEVYPGSNQCVCSTLEHTKTWFIPLHSAPDRWDLPCFKLRRTSFHATTVTGMTCTSVSWAPQLQFSGVRICEQQAWQCGTLLLPSSLYWGTCAFVGGNRTKRTRLMHRGRHEQCPCPLLPRLQGRLQLGLPDGKVSGHQLEE
jgi:hypothetical protein